MHLRLMYKRPFHPMSNAGRLLVTSSVDHLLTPMAALVIAVALLCSACGDLPKSDQSEQSEQHNDAAGSNVANADEWDIASVDPDAPWLPVLATRDLAVGVKRIAFSLDGLGPTDEPPTVRVSLFALDEERAVPRSVQYARFISYDPEIRIAAHGHANSSVSDRSLPIGRGVYVAPVQLESAGLWGMLLEIASDHTADTVRVRFSVRERAAAPGIGEQAPSVASRTRADVSSFFELTSDPEPEPGLYAMSIAEALALDRPLLLAFATPAFCHSRTCAPVLDAVKAVWRDHSDSVTGIHVEVFENPDNPSLLIESEAFVAWRLPSEPWVFVIDETGVIRYAFEGAVTEAELRSAVEWVVQDEG